MRDEVYAFDRFTLNVVERRLTAARRRIALEPKTFDVLTALVRNGGRLVTKEALLNAVWPTSFVDEGILSVHIARLRKALGDTAAGVPCIETVTRSGYRLASMPVTVADDLQVAAPRSSIAVLPFADMSPGSDQVWFSDGLSEEIINLLTRIPELKVVARTSAFAFRHAAQDLTRIADTLGVNAILEGSVRRAGQRVRVSATLVDARSGARLWSDRYDRSVTDIFAIQDAIAHEIVSALAPTLGPPSLSPAGHGRSLPAYDAFLQGRHQLYRLTPESLLQSRRCFERAIALDPTFVMAHLGLSEYFFTIGNIAGQSESLPRARDSARRALELEPRTPQAHALLGMIASTYDFNWQEVDREFRLALAISPVPPFVRDVYGAFYLLQVGRVEEGGAQIEWALRDDPLNLMFRTQYGIFLVAAEQDEQAATLFLQVIESDPSYPLSCVWLSVTYALRGQLAEARHYAERAHALVSSPLFLGTLAGIARRQGDRTRSDELISALQEPGQPGHAIGFALFHLMSLEYDLALQRFEEAIARQDAMAMLPVLFRRCCSTHPRWTAAAGAMNLDK